MILSGHYPDWYLKYMFYEEVHLTTLLPFKIASFLQDDGFGRLSDYAISFHYVPPAQMYVYEYMIYSVGYRLGQSSQKEEKEDLMESKSKEGEKPNE